MKSAELSAAGAPLLFAAPEPPELPVDWAPPVAEVPDAEIEWLAWYTVKKNQLVVRCTFVQYRCLHTCERRRVSGIVVRLDVCVSERLVLAVDDGRNIVRGLVRERLGQDVPDGKVDGLLE